MFKAGDRVKKKDGTTFSNGKKVLTVERVQDCRHATKIWLKETGSFILSDTVEVVREMFEVGKKYSNVRCATKGDIAEVLLISGTGVCLEWKREKRLFTLDQKSFSDGWKEFVEPKVYSIERSVVIGDGDKLYLVEGSNTFLPKACMGKIRITYTEGSGIAVETLEGADTGTI